MSTSFKIDLLTNRGKSLSKIGLIDTNNYSDILIYQSSFNTDRIPGSVDVFASFFITVA